MPETTIIAARSGGKTIHIEATQLSSEQEISGSQFDFDQICDSLSGIIDALKKTLEKAGPKKTTVEFGVEIGAESGQLTALLVKGSGKANLKVTVEWS